MAVKCGGRGGIDPGLCRRAETRGSRRVLVHRDRSGGKGKFRARTLLGNIAHLTLDAAAYPPANSMVHSGPPVEALEKVKCASGADLARGVRIAGVHDAGLHEHGYKDARGGEGTKGKGVREVGLRSRDEESMFSIHL